MNQTKAPKPSISFRAPSSLGIKAVNEPTRVNNRPPLREIQNNDLRRILSDEISFGDRRVVSNPNTKQATVIHPSSRRHSSLNMPRSRVLDSSDFSENEVKKSRFPSIIRKEKNRTDTIEQPTDSVGPCSSLLSVIYRHFWIRIHLSIHSQLEQVGLFLLILLYSLFDRIKRSTVKSLSCILARCW